MGYSSEVGIAFHYIVSEYVACYRDKRLHQGIGNKLIGAHERNEPQPVINEKRRCQCAPGARIGNFERQIRSARAMSRTQVHPVALVLHFDHESRF